MARHAVLIARLDPYWKMEAGSAVILPVLMIWLAKGHLGWISIIPIAAMVLLLLIGASYWRAKLGQLREKANIRPTLQRIKAMRLPAMLLTAAGMASAAAVWLVPGLALGEPERWVTAAAATLALLEYVNYYHRQLQHFDNAADFKRLLTGKGFRPSQMARDLKDV